MRPVLFADRIYGLRASPVKEDRRMVRPVSVGRPAATVRPGQARATSEPARRSEPAAAGAAGGTSTSRRAARAGWWPGRGCRPRRRTPAAGGRSAGAAGFSSTNTGLGASRAPHCPRRVGRLAALTMFTGMVWGWKPGCLNVTENSLAATDTSRACGRPEPARSGPPRPAGLGFELDGRAAGAPPRQFEARHPARHAGASARRGRRPRWRQLGS